MIFDMEPKSVSFIIKLLNGIFGPVIGLGPWGIFFLAGGLFIYSLFFVDINSTSLHGFYRDRLSEAFLFDVSPRIGSTDDLQISELNAAGSKAPYHLINTTLNLQGSKDPDVRGRNADFFIISKCYSGSDQTKYCATEGLEYRDGHFNLGTGLAISGGAAAPNMGESTIRPLVFVMALLNIRLGYWLPNPRHMASSLYRFYFQRIGVGPLYLLRELLGKMDARRLFVNVSDGGHIENLGLYQLLRRRCKYIIVSDAVEDEDMGFGALAKVLRFAQTDMGVDIDIDLDVIRSEDERSWALGDIHYGGGETGHLIYIKSSVSGTVNEYVREYRIRNGKFPHETTINQFFSEEKFEVYRALGYHIAGDLGDEDVSVDDFDSFYKKLEQRASR